MAFEPSGVGWSYGSFHDFKKRLALQIGLDLETMKGFGGEKSWDGIDDPIVPLLRCGDEGEFPPEQCSQMAPRLRELVKDWDEDRGRALELAGDMDHSARTGKPLVYM